MWLKEPELLTRRIDRIRCWTADELLTDPRRMQGIFLFSVTSILVRENHPAFYLTEAVGIKKLMFNPSSAEAKNWWAYTSIPPVCLTAVITGII